MVVKESEYIVTGRVRTHSENKTVEEHQWLKDGQKEKSRLNGVRGGDKPRKKNVTEADRSEHP